MTERNTTVQKILIEFYSSLEGYAASVAADAPELVKAQADIEALIAEAVREARIDELKRLKKYLLPSTHHSQYRMYKTRFQDRLAQLQAREEKRK